MQNTRPSRANGAAFIAIAVAFVLSISVTAQASSISAGACGQSPGVFCDFRASNTNPVHAIAPPFGDGYGNTITPSDSANAAAFNNPMTDTGAVASAFAALTSYPSGPCCGGEASGNAAAVWTIGSEPGAGQAGHFVIEYNADAYSSSDRQGEIVNYSQAKWEEEIRVSGSTQRDYTANGTSYGKAGVVYQSWSSSLGEGSPTGAHGGHVFTLDLEPGDTVSFAAFASATFDASAVIDPTITSLTPGFFVEGGQPLAGPFDLAPPQSVLDQLASSGVDVAALAAEGLLNPIGTTSTPTLVPEPPSWPILLVPVVMLAARRQRPREAGGASVPLS